MSEDERDFSADADADSRSDSDSESESDPDSRGDSERRPADGDVSRTTATDETAQEWGRIPIDVDEGADNRTDPAESSNDDDTEEEVFGPEPSSTPIESGAPSLENALFVVLGAIAMGLVLFRLVSLGIGG
ncbi:hypothetical protein OB955_20490 [Halobacteria archaeon AArc-m2/3/4]|uniref:DUF7312 domain-containing protein n=1 Tax=Natronoglomus mannanivorans TaxID=2979990 RepID=A0ABT2QJL8_9EURY|nr:hypothetical protein [Halobacteria archaeon AArc-m2/3/4]